MSIFGAGTRCPFLMAIHGAFEYICTSTKHVIFADEKARERQAIRASTITEREQSEVDEREKRRVKRRDRHYRRRRRRQEREKQAAKFGQRGRGGCSGNRGNGQSGQSRPQVYISDPARRRRYDHARWAQRRRAEHPMYSRAWEMRAWRKQLNRCVRDACNLGDLNGQWQRVERSGKAVTETTRDFTSEPPLLLGPISQGWVSRTLTF